MNELDLFADAIAIANREDRSAFLDRKCSGRPDLRQRLAQLLEAHANSQALFDRSRHDPNATAAQESVAGYVGAIIAGRYKLLEQIGDGGMGTVWMAEQKEPVKRLVAVKLIKAGMDSKAVLARFEAERQALALMDHPNIAKVHDAGTDDHGRPYFVMELVKGLPLTEYCDNRKLSVNERLDLFVQICSAVQHAHQKAIIHRDLKPSNVLVTEHDGKPVPKVIDFGLAKALNSSQMLTDRTLHTAYGTVVGTPLYMAPEQVGINALDVDTRTDIYALGVILYELLTGTTPLEKARFKEAAWEEVKRLIREEEPPRPSTRLSTSATLSSLAASRQIEPAQLSRLIRGELDWIVMKSLEKDRTRRYETANGLAKDVQRYLTGDSVEACPPTLSYRLRKMYRRHRTAVGLAAVILGSLLIATVFSVGFGMVAARARAVAESAEQAVVVERDEAFQQRKQAEIERDAAQAARAELRRSHYLAAMSLIPSAWKADNVSRVIELLNEQLPKPGDPDDLRGFEWHYWNRLCREHTREMPLGEDVHYCAISGDGSRVAVVRKAKDSVPEQVEGSRFPLENYRIEIIDLATGRVVRELATLKMQYFKMRLNQDGNRLVMELNDGKKILMAWDVATGRELLKISMEDKQLPQSAVALSPSGRRVAVVQFKGNRRLFEEPSDQAKFTLLDLDHPNGAPKSFQFQLQRPVSKSRHTVLINDLCFNASEDHVAFLIDPLMGGSFFPDEEPERLDCSVHLVDVPTMKIHKVADAQAKRLRIAFSPEGNHITGITTGPERLLRWDISNPDQCKEVLAKQLDFSFQLVSTSDLHRPFEIAHSPNGQNLLLTTINHPTLWIINPYTGDLKRTLKTPGNIQARAFSSSGDAIRAVIKRDALHNTEYVMHQWDIAETQVRNGQNENRRIRTTISPDRERQAVYIVDENKVSIRNRHGVELHSFAVQKLRSFQPSAMELDRVQTKTKWSYPGVLLTFSRNGRYLCVRANNVPYGFKGSILETDTGKVCWTLGDMNIDNDPKSRFLNRTLTILSDDQRYLALFGVGNVQVVSLDDPEDRFEIKTKSRSNGAFSPDGKRLIVEDRESIGTVFDVGRMQLWDVENKRLIRTEEYGPPYDAFSADSQYFATVAMTSNRRQILHFCNATNGEELWTTDLIDQNGCCLAIHPRGKSLVSFNISSTLYKGRISAPTIWDTRTGKILGWLEGIAGKIEDVLYSPDGNRIVTLSRSQKEMIEVRLWDATTFRELLTLTHHVLPGGTLTFSSDGNRLTYDTWMTPEDPNYGGITWDATPQETGRK